jgi:glyoxylase-like metal-dependent hydrolase (beta-lactamase superfamily II)
MTLDGTNTWLLRLPGDQTYVVDPGPLDEGHLQRVAAAGPLAGILLTHGHPDHVEGVDRLVEITGAPVLTGPGSHRPGSDRPGSHGPRSDRPRSDGPAGLEWIPAPGHTSDSVCFLIDVDGERAVLTGDTILGRGTAVVAFPDGDLGDYLDSLRRLEQLGRIPVLPGHGPVLADCSAAARYYLDHRRTRLEQVRAALAAGAGTPREVVEMVYADVDRSLWPWAEWSVRAQLAYLESRPHGVRWDTP